MTVFFPCRNQWDTDLPRQPAGLPGLFLRSGECATPALPAARRELPKAAHPARPHDVLPSAAVRDHLGPAPAGYPLTALEGWWPRRLAHRFFLPFIPPMPLLSPLSEDRKCHVLCCSSGARFPRALFSPPSLKAPPAHTPKLLLGNAGPWTDV